ncbi:hypothetical protein M8C21_009950 [Ambrosia artemisiifolia]|uniref:Uncharacterized protein n=1 Tax=Ambrosia artemisiifolia TaxID=4212 RepID=A0AAD5CXY2_AMBAR|nr:hypothetical protein M8C21_009950 [Ambrosia artemisiifolia]
MMQLLCNRQSVEGDKVLDEKRLEVIPHPHQSPQNHHRLMNR